MYNFLSSLTGFLKLGNTQTDNWVFKLHYKFTVLILIAFSIIVSTSQFFGDPIDCVMSGPEIPQKVIDNYCWVHSTYTLPRAQNQKVGVNVPYPGIDKTNPDDEKVYHAYYQWVCFFLFLQAMLFYVPRFAWRILEGKTVDKLLMQLSKPFMSREANEPPEIAKISNQQRVQNYATLLADYLERTKGKRRAYAYTYYICELANFVNVVGAIYFANAFLGGEFTTYGTQVIQFTMENEVDRTDPMIKVFPRITKCTFRRFGPSGDIQNHDAMCILPINMLNEKIFIFLWFYYILLSVISGLVVLWHLIEAVVPFLRRREFLGGIEKFDPETNKKNPLYDNVENFVNNNDLSDWFLLKLLKKNINSLNFEELAKCLGKRIKPADEKGHDDNNYSKVDDNDDESGKSLLTVRSQ